MSGCIKKRSRLSRPIFVRAAISVAAITLAAGNAAAQPMSTTFTYQGQLKQSGSLVNGTADVRFRLYDALTGGTLLGSEVTTTGVAVTGGVFSCPVNFGEVWQGNGRNVWIEVAVRSPAGSGSFITLTPRQPVTAAPKSLVSKAIALPYLDSLSTGETLIELHQNGTTTNPALLCTGGSDAFNASIIRAHNVGPGNNSSGALWGRHDGNGLGVVGQAYGASGWGVYGEGYGTAGRGVSGTAFGSGGIGTFGAQLPSGNYGYMGTADVGVGGVAAQAGSSGVVGTHTPSGNVGRLATLSYGVLGVIPGNVTGSHAVYGDNQFWQCHGSLGAHGGQGVLGVGGPLGGVGVWAEGTNGAAVLARSDGQGSALDADWRSSGTSFPDRNNIARFKNNGNNVARIDNTGRGFFNGGTQASGADVAEAMLVEGGAGAYEPGDVLVISTTSTRTLARSTEPYSTLVAGVHATKPGLLLTDRHIDDSLAGTVPCGVVGIIPTKVTAENGAIRRGDLLVTSSTPGHAMKGTDRERMLGAIIGKALEDFNGDGVGLIEVMVNTK